MSETLENSGQMAAWANEIRAIGNGNPLLTFEPNAFGQLDLEKAHPGGLAQFVSGKATTLSSLYREPLHFSKGLSAAKRIAEKGAKLEQNFGLKTIHLAGGLVGLKRDGFDLALPIFLWTVELRRKVEDYEVARVGSAIVNPALVEALEVGYGVRIDVQRLLGILANSHELVPIEALAYIAEVSGTQANLETRPLLTIANFAPEIVVLAQDLPRQDTELLRILAGLDNAGEPLRPGEIDLVIDADAAQQAIVANAVAGNSFAVETLPGCGYTQTVVNLLANIVKSGQTALVVAPRRQTLNELADRFASTGLNGLGVRSSAVWFDLVASISRHEKAAVADLDAAKQKLSAATAGVQEYFGVLSNKSEAVGYSIDEILAKLANLNLMPHAPTTSARISRSRLAMHLDPSKALELLSRASDLGQFEYGPQDSPWFGSRFADAHEIQTASDTARKLHEGFDSLRTAMSTFVLNLGLKPATTFEDWGVYLQLAAGVQLTLDRFSEDVFERDLAPLVVATAQRSSRSEMSGSDRRRLRKLAKEYLRPGMHVSDMHQALVEIQEQKNVWAASAIGDSKPHLTGGVSDLNIKYRGFAADLASIQAHLEVNDDTLALVRLSLGDLGTTLGKMANDLTPLKNFSERTLLVAELSDLGLAEVVRDFARLHVRKENLAVEFAQAFWQTALEYAVAKDSRILSFTAERIEVLEQDFRDAEAEVIKLGAAKIAELQAKAWHSALLANPTEADALKALLKTRSASFTQLDAIAPSFKNVLTPVVMASPYEVSAIMNGRSFDFVVVLDAAGTTVAENLGALKRAKHVIAFGDDAIASPFGFELECSEQPVPLEPADRSIFAVIRESFGVHSLRRSWRPNGQTLGDLINREFYQNRIWFEPTAREYLGESNFSLVKTKSLQAELERVTQLVINHAETNPELSLLVGTASRDFAEQLDAAITRAKLERPELEEFFDSHGREKFEVASIAELSHRIADVVIFSLGVKESPELLADPNARKFVANLLVSARSRITVVSTIEAIDSDWPMSKLLNDVFAHANPVVISDSDIQNDAMLTDLAIRLRKLGARVTLGFGENLPLVISYGNRAAVVLADWMQLEQPLTERLRLRPALLQAMGWQLIRVRSFELFSDPQTLALRIGIAVGMPLSKSQPSLFEERSKDDTDLGWGERGDSNDRRLRDDKPPHWG